MADAEVASIMGRGDALKGTVMLSEMKSAHALDVSGDGVLDFGEFARLYDPQVRANAESFVASTLLSGLEPASQHSSESHK